MPLSDTQIKRLKPSDKCTPKRPDKYTDGDGLRLWVRHTGNKVWVTDYKLNGKRQSLTIGKYPRISLAQARLQHQQIKEQVAMGIDPKQAKKEQKAKTDGSRLFSTIAEQWYGERKSYLAPSTFSRNYSAYLRDVKPIIGHKDIDDITPQNILAIGKAIEQRNAHEMAKRTIREVGQVFKHAIINGLTLQNPTVNIANAIKPHKTEHHNRIDVQQLPKLLQDIDNHTGNVLVKLGLWFICYTFLRTKEVRFLAWADIDFTDKIIRMPADKMKAKRKHLVPLSPQVIKILEQIKCMGLSSDYVFFNPYTQKPLSSHAFIKALYDMGYKDEMTVHGFRGLASTILHEQGFRHEAIELQLAHDKENKISKAYDGSQHLAYRTDMMNQWADFIDNAFTGEVKTPSHISQS